MVEKPAMSLKKFLTELSLAAHEEGRRLTVIRNFGGLPEVNIGNDIDLIIHESDVDRWLNIICRLSVMNSLHLEVTKQFYYCTKLKILGGGFSLELDLNNRFEWRGVCFFDVGDLILESTPYNDIIYTSSAFRNAYITFHHSFLYGGFINYKYKYQYKVLIDNIAEFEERLESLGGRYARRVIVAALKRNEDVSRAHANFLRSWIWFRQFRKSPIRVVSGLCKSLYYDRFG